MFPTLVLDLDGTLVDSKLDLIPSLNAITATRGVLPISMDDVGALVGQGVLPMISRAFSFHGRDLDDATLKTLFKDYLDQTLSVAKIQEYSAPKVSIVVNPSHQDDGLTHVATSERSTSVGPLPLRNQSWSIHTRQRFHLRQVGSFSSKRRQSKANVHDLLHPSAFRRRNGYGRSGTENMVRLQPG